MHKYGDILTNIFEIKIDYQDDRNFILKHSSLLFFVDCSNENNIHEEWTLRMDNEPGDEFIVSGDIARETFRTYFNNIPHSN